MRTVQKNLLYSFLDENLNDKKCKQGKILPITVSEGPEGEWRYSSTLLTLAPVGRWMVSATPCLLYLQERDLVLIVHEAGRALEMVWMGT
jgi:hypothetical protein